MLKIYRGEEWVMIGQGVDPGRLRARWRCHPDGCGYVVVDGVSHQMSSRGLYFVVTLSASLQARAQAYLSVWSEIGSEIEIWIVCNVDAVRARHKYLYGIVHRKSIYNVCVTGNSLCWRKSRSVLVHLEIRGRMFPNGSGRRMVLAEYLGRDSVHNRNRCTSWVLRDRNGYGRA